MWKADVVRCLKRVMRGAGFARRFERIVLVKMMSRFYFFYRMLPSFGIHLSLSRILLGGISLNHMGKSVIYYFFPARVLWV